MKSKSSKLILFLTGLLALFTIVSIAFYWQPLVAWYEFQHEFETLPMNAQGLPEYKHRQTGIIFVKVPGGTFMMGSPEDEVGREENEGPQHRISLPSFLISKYEVSQVQWVDVMGNNPSIYEGDNYPVENVTWNECVEFCKKLTLSLPTEEQWEYACRSGTTTSFSFGDTVTGKQVNYFTGGGIAHFIKDGVRIAVDLNRTLPVNELKPNHWGLFNMHGNVEEWCLKRSSGNDMFEEFSFYPENIARGGSFLSTKLGVRSTSFREYLANQKRANIGFRPVRNLE